MFWTIFFAVFMALCLFKLLDEVNPFAFLEWFVDKRGHFKPAVKVFAFAIFAIGVVVASVYAGGGH